MESNRIIFLLIFFLVISIIVSTFAVENLTIINNNDKQPLYQKPILHIKILFVYVLDMCITRLLRK